MIRPSKTLLRQTTFCCYEAAKNIAGFMHWLNNADGEIFYYPGYHYFYYFVEKPNYNYLKELKAYFIAKRKKNTIKS